MSIRRQRYGVKPEDDDFDPMATIANLFDVAMVFAVALMVAFAINMRMTEFLTQEDVTYVKNAGSPDMEIVVKKDNKITKYKADSAQGSGKGQRIGIAYRLESGEVVYVPENGE